MKVKLGTIMASPEGCYPVGSIIEVTKQEGEYLIQSGQATSAEPERKQQKPETGETAEGTEEEIETAEAEAGTETAEAPRGRGRKRK